MSKFVVLYLVSLAIFLVIDFIWLAFIAKNLYAKSIGHLMTDKVNFVAAFVFYLIFIAGLTHFVTLPALSKGITSKVIFNAALFGFVTYATYDLTNLATLKDWPLKVTIIDLIWGMFISTSVSTLTLWVSKFFNW